MQNKILYKPFKIFSGTFNRLSIHFEISKHWCKQNTCKANTSKEKVNSDLSHKFRNIWIFNSSEKVVSRTQNSKTMPWNVIEEYWRTMFNVFIKANQSTILVRAHSNLISLPL